MSGLSGKVVVVLGAATKDNMGQIIARRFAEKGAKVVLGSRNEAALRALATEIGGAARRCDITVKADVDGLIDAAASTYGVVDIGINATGVGIMSPFLDTSTADLERATAVQFIGPFQYFQAWARAMTKGGSIR